MAFFGQAMIVCVAVALVALGASRRAADRRARLRRPRAARCSARSSCRGSTSGRRRSTAAALCALVTGRLRLGHVALGAAIAAKLYPAVLVPLAVVYVWRREGRREALVCAGLHARRRRPSSFAALRRAGAGRRLGQPVGPGLAPAADREPRRGHPARRAPRLRDRGRDGVEPRLAEPRRDGAGRARRAARRCCRPRRSSRRGSCSRAGRRPASGSCSRARPPSSPSSRSARCSRRSS